MATEWDDLRPRFRDLVIRMQHRHGETIRAIAAQIDVNTTTVYRLMGHTSRPTTHPDRRLMRDVERFVAEHEPAPLPRQRTKPDESEG